MDPDAVSGAPPAPVTVLPPELRALLEARGDDSHGAWDAFAARFSPLMLHIARSVMGKYDGAMDAYTYILERLRRDDCQALRVYEPDGRSQFTTWLAVVSRRICVDYYRQAYGRPRSEETTSDAHKRRLEMQHAARRRLVDFAWSSVDLAHVIDHKGRSPDSNIRESQLHAALDAAVLELGAEDRLLLKLRFTDELSAAAIARVLAMPSQFHVYRRLRSVCDSLRSALAQRGVESAIP